jgi:hypothetical protein
MIIECPHCHTRVLPKADNICPACRENILDTQDVDPNTVSLTVRESQDLPPYCYLCNSYTERYVKIEGDPEATWETMIRTLVPHWKRQTDEATTNVFINLPQCEACAEREEPTPLYVDYDEQTMTFVVHQGFKERVQPTPVDNQMPENDQVNEEENTK